RAARGHQAPKISGGERGRGRHHAERRRGEGARAGVPAAGRRRAALSRIPAQDDGNLRSAIAPFSVIPAERSESRDPCNRIYIAFGSIGPGSRFARPGRQQLLTEKSPLLTEKSRRTSP